MNYIILLFGTSVALAGAILLVRPAYIFGLFKKHADSIGLQFFAVAVRILLGIVLVIGASESRFPVVLQVLGWLSIAAALILGVIGRGRFQALIKWALELRPAFQRLSAVFAILFGCFLVYAVL